MNLKYTAFTSILMAFALGAGAVPAKPGLIPVAQADGTVVNIRLCGDEFQHFTTTEDGYYIVEKDGFYWYADIDSRGNTVLSNHRVLPAEQRDDAAQAYLRGVDMDNVRAQMQRRAEARDSRLAQTTHYSMPGLEHINGQRAGAGLFPGSHFPAHGEQKGLVILVEYKDVKFTLDNPLDYFTRMLNEPGFNDYGATGSAADFFREVSAGQFLPEFDVYGPITLSRNMSYYGGNDWSNNDEHPAEMVSEACQQLDSVIDFTEYDRDGDGEVDNVFIFYAGRGEASGGSANTVWPHAWNVEHGIGYRPEHDGVYISRYACSNEWESGRPDGVGTFVHEFSHVLGLPDLYATSYTSAFTPGSWSAMDYGPYNNDGMTPPLYSAFERYALGWMEPMPIDRPLNATLPPIGENKAGIVKYTDNEFFLFENRQKTGWDTYIPGHGMLVWHVDYNSSVWNSNVVNNTSSHQYVDIEEADGTQSEYSRDGDAFPGASNVTSFTDDTRPSMKTWKGHRMETPITEIAEKDGIITFKAKGGRTEAMPVPVALESPENDDESFVAAWEPMENVNFALTVYSLGDESDTPAYILKDSDMGTETSFRVTGLEAGCQYYYYVRTTDGWEYSDPSGIIEATTGPLPLNKKNLVVLDATEIDHQSFTANWEGLPEANDYLLTVSEMTLTGQNHDVIDFADGTESLPGGWMSTTQSSYLNTAYSGTEIPSLRMSRGGDSLTSPRYDEPISGLSFWHRGNATNDGDVLEITAVTPSGNRALDPVPVIRDKGGVVTEIDFEEAGITDATGVIIRYVRTGEKGAVAIDDVDVAYGITAEYKVLEDMDMQSTGDVTSYRVTGLKPETHYVYTLYATDGTLTSHCSPMAHVLTTSDPSGVRNVAADAEPGITRVYDILGSLVKEIPAGSRPSGLQPGIYILRTGNSSISVRL